MSSDQRLGMALALTGLLALGPVAPAIAAGSGAGQAAGWDPLTGAIGLYQRYLSPLRAGHCYFEPSCSQYAREAIQSRGPLVGMALAADRLMRCNGSAPRFHARGAGGLLQDPVEGPPPAPGIPRLPPWLAPPPEAQPPPGPPDAEEGAAFGRWLADRGECERAGTEFLRAAFLAAEPAWEAWARSQLGGCLWSTGDWPAAESAFERSALISPSPAVRRQACYLAAAALFQEGRYRAAARRLWELPPATGEDLAPALLGVCEMARGRWDEADRALGRALAATPDPTTATRLRILSAAAARGPSLPHRSPTAATVMSAILPGSGQVYAGRVRDGLRHLIFDGALIYTVAKLASDDHYPAAYLVGSLAFSFYLGNILGANAGARAYNRTQRLRLTAGTLVVSELR